MDGWRRCWRVRQGSRPVKPARIRHPANPPTRQPANPPSLPPLPQWLSQEYREILKNAKRIQDEFKDRPRALAYIIGIVTDLYVDWHKYNGRGKLARAGRGGREGGCIATTS